MRAGKLDSVVQIQRATVTINAAGSPSETWATIGSLRAEVVNLVTAEVIRSVGGAVDDRTLVIRTWFMPGVTTADRVVFDGRTYNIKGLSIIGRNRGLELRAEAREAEG